MFYKCNCVHFKLNFPRWVSAQPKDFCQNAKHFRKKKIFFLSDPEEDVWGARQRGQEKYVEQAKALSVLAN